MKLRLAAAFTIGTGVGEAGVSNIIVVFKNHLLLAPRSVARNRILALINIAGLSIVISAVLVIFLIVYYEFREMNKDLIPIAARG
jgi:hypothetical protein